MNVGNNKIDDLLTEEKALFKQMQHSMKSEVDDLSNKTTRRGFLHSVVTGSAFLGVIGSGGSVLAWGCCEQNCLICNVCMIGVVACGNNCESGCEVKCQPCETKCVTGCLCETCQYDCLYTCENKCVEKCQDACIANPASQHCDPNKQICGSGQQGCVPGFECGYLSGKSS